MAKKRTEPIKIITKLLTSLRNHKITIREAYLFGSWTKETNTKCSDIDVALISDDFTGIRYFDIKKIGRIVRNVDYRIEAHTFSSSDADESMFLDEIIRNGIKIL